MTTLQQIELTQGNIDDLSIQIQDRIEAADCALNSIPTLVHERGHQRRELARLLKVRAIELDDLERFGEDMAETVAGVEAMFGPEIAAQFIEQNRPRRRE
jgi:hypothetical protein